MFLNPGVNNLLVFEFPTWFTTMTPISTKIRMAMLMKPMTIDFFCVLPVGGTRWFKWSPCCLWFLCAVALSRFGGFSVLALKIKFTRSTTLEQHLTSLTSQVCNCHRYFHHFVFDFEGQSSPRWTPCRQPTPWSTPSPRAALQGSTMISSPPQNHIELRKIIKLWTLKWTKINLKVCRRNLDDQMYHNLQRNWLDFKTVLHLRY